MPDFKKFDELQTWLKGQPREIAVAIAARSAARVLPFATRSEDFQAKDKLVLFAMRAILTAGVVGYSCSPMHTAMDPCARQRI